MTPLLGFHANTKERNNSVLELRGGTEESSTDPYSIFLFAMRSPKTREKCTGRLKSKQMNNSDPERK
jgi:hypothetical protein